MFCFSITVIAVAYSSRETQWKKTFIKNAKIYPCQSNNERNL